MILLQPDETGNVDTKLNNNSVSTVVSTAQYYIIL